jgi:hypothetical protein
MARQGKFAKWQETEHDTRHEEGNLMRKTIGLILASLIAVLFPTVVAAPANAACVATSKGTSLTYLVDDDEAAAYVIFASRVYYEDCAGYIVVTKIAATWRPNTYFNTKLSCNSTIIDKVKMNPSPVAGLNPGEHVWECDPDGGGYTWDVKNTAIWSGADHCMSQTSTVVKAFLPDWTRTGMLNVCLPN